MKNELNDNGNIFLDVLVSLAAIFSYCTIGWVIVSDNQYMLKENIIDFSVYEAFIFCILLVLSWVLGYKFNEKINNKFKVGEIRVSVFTPIRYTMMIMVLLNFRNYLDKVILVEENPLVNNSVELISDWISAFYMFSFFIILIICSELLKVGVGILSFKRT